MNYYNVFIWKITNKYIKKTNYNESLHLLTAYGDSRKLILPYRGVMAFLEKEMADKKIM